MARRWWRSPAVMTVSYLLLGLVVYWALAWFTERNTTSERFVNSLPFRIWIGFATASVGVWTMLLSRGVATIRSLPESWKRSRSWWAGNLAVYLVFVSALAALMAAVRGTPLDVPMQAWPGLVRVLLVVGATGFAPWVLLVWMAHEQVRRTRAATARASALDVGSAVADLLVIWRVIQSCSLAIGLGVVPIVLNTGVIRIALIDTSTMDEQRFPSYAVLAYGALFAAAASVAVIPLVIAYRSVAVELVERALGAPETGVPSQQWVEERSRLEAHLNIDAAMLRSPITALSLLTPFASAALAAFVPT